MFDPDNLIYLAQFTVGNTGTSAGDRIIAMIIQLTTGAIGVGFMVDAATGSFGKKDVNEKGKNVMKALGWFIGTVLVASFLPRFLGLGSGFFEML